MAIEKFASIPFSQIADIGIHMNTPTNKLTALANDGITTTPIVVTTYM